MKNPNNLTTDLKRALALKQFNSEDFFLIEGKAYEGTIEEAEEAYDEQKEEEDKIEFSQWCEDNLTEIDERGEDDGDYLVLTDSEADDRFEDALDSYIQDCIIPEIPKYLQNYFDEDKWKQDARYDGRGNSLATYDGDENEEVIEGESFYIYRTN